VPGARPGADVTVMRTAVHHALNAAGGVLKPALAVLKPSAPKGDVRLEAGDVLTFVGSLDAVTALWTTIGLRAAAAPVKMEHEPYTHRLVEVVMTDTSEAVGHRVVQLPLEYRRDFHSRVVAIAFGKHHEGEEFSEMRVVAGDTLVLEVSPSFLYDARNEADFALVRRLSGYKIKRTSRAPIAGGIALAMVLLAGSGVTTMLNAALLATFAMIATGCLSFRTAFKSLEFEVIVVLGAAVGLGAAVTDSGLAEAVASLLVAVGGGSPYLALVIIFLGAVIATNVINAAAAAALLFPVVVGMAAGMGVSAMPFVMVLMLAASYSFVNPAGFQTNLMVQKPGGYTFMDFAKVGLPITVLVGVVVCVLTPVFCPFALP
ncbi:MAG TPA: SLC13 family permease, partial [Thermoleophilia bacterium]|nr:SLC13 family permease [Thermoleophilia bacterium]